MTDLSEWPSGKDDVYGFSKDGWKVIGKGDDPTIVKNRGFLVGPYLAKSCGHWVMAYHIFKSVSCPVCDPHWKWQD